jgi:hypothetical protein
MKSGAWHQFGDRSQKLALEQLELGVGKGVVVSARDLSYEKAAEYASKYRDADGDVLLDLQFYLPESRVGRISSYEDLNKFRMSTSRLQKLGDKGLSDLSRGIEGVSKRVGVAAVVAPSVILEAGRADIADLNARLFAAAKSAGDTLGVPTYASAMLSQSVLSSVHTLDETMSMVTQQDAAGWYFGVEFGDMRVPATHNLALRLCDIGITLACTGKPVFHAFAGPMCILSPCFGATAAGIGHSQNLWQFRRTRLQPSEGGGGGGDAPPRLFSKPLWGTIVYEDEFALLTPETREAILTPTPYCSAVKAKPPYLQWNRWDANKHLVCVLAQYSDEALLERDPGSATDAAIQRLREAQGLHAKIAGEGVALTDQTNGYQHPWRAALESLKSKGDSDFELIRMIRASGSGD